MVVNLAAILGPVLFTQGFVFLCRLFWHGLAPKGQALSWPRVRPHLCPSLRGDMSPPEGKKYESMSPFLCLVAGFPCCSWHWQFRWVGPAWRPQEYPSITVLLSILAVLQHPKHPTYLALSAAPVESGSSSLPKTKPSNPTPANEVCSQKRHRRERTRLQTENEAAQGEEERSIEEDAAIFKQNILFF